MQAEAAALKVPVRFLQTLRTLIPQTAGAADIEDEEDVWSDAEPDAADLLAAAQSRPANETSSEEEDVGAAASELQTALMAAPQMLAADSGEPCCTAAAVECVSFAPNLMTQ